MIHATLFVMKFERQNGAKNETSIIQKQLTTVTPLSKYLAMALFIILPFAGFWLGTQNAQVFTEPVADIPTITTESPVSESAPDTETTPTKTVSTPTQTNSIAAVTPPKPTIVTAYITEITLDLITLDNIAIYQDSAAVNKMVADGLCPASETQKCRLENGVYYRNTDPSVRTYVLSHDVETLTWTGSKYSLSKLNNSTPNKTPYSITINSGGVVTKIKEIYRP